MKKFFLSAIMLVSMCLSANAQAKVIFDGYNGVDIKVKRCYVHGNDCIVDVLITNNTRSDLRTSVGVGDGLFRTDLCAYDDEGNTYNKYVIRGTYGGVSFGGSDYACANGVTIPREVSVKLQFKIKNIDEYATLITSLICNFRGMSNEAYGAATMQLKNVPITRE